MLGVRLFHSSLDSLDLCQFSSQSHQFCQKSKCVRCEKALPKIIKAACCGSAMISGHLRFSGLENRFKIKGHLREKWLQQCSLSLKLCGNIDETEHLINKLSSFGAKTIFKCK